MKKIYGIICAKYSKLNTLKLSYNFKKNPTRQPHVVATS